MLGEQLLQRRTPPPVWPAGPVRSRVEKIEDDVVRWPLPRGSGDFDAVQA
jgi:hypothetical protein